MILSLSKNQIDVVGIQRPVVPPKVDGRRVGGGTKREGEKRW